MGEHQATTAVQIDLAGLGERAQSSGPQWSYESTDLDLTLLTWNAQQGIASHVNDEVDVVLVVVAGAGEATVVGELPADAEDFYQALQALPPDLRGTQFAVCALGDRSYDPFFCEAGKMFERLLIQLGATPVVAQFEIDGGPTAADIEQVQRWVLNLVDTLRGIPA